MKKLPNSIGLRLLQLMSLMSTNLVNATSSMVLDERDLLWEVACSDNSWLTSEVQKSWTTWVRLQDLRRRHGLKRIWFSFPCTKWCQFTNLNYNTLERREVLETAQRRERKMLKNAKQMLQALDEDPDFDIYWEWTNPCAGWEQQPVVDLREGRRARGLDGYLAELTAVATA